MLTKNNKKTEKLINNLTEDLSVTRLLPSPRKRMIIWGVFSLIVSAIIAGTISGFRPDISKKINDLWFISENILMMLIVFTTLFSAFRLSTPDIKKNQRSIYIIMTNSFLWLAFICFSIFNSSSISFAEITEAIAHMHISHCITDFVYITTIPAIIIFTLVKKSASTAPAWAGYAVLLSVSTTGALIMRYVCHVDEQGHLLLTHFIPAFMMSLLGIVIGKLLLRW